MGCCTSGVATLVGEMGKVARSSRCFQTTPYVCPAADPGADPGTDPGADPGTDPGADQCFF